MQRAPVGVADLAREQRPAPLDQLVAGGEHADDGSRHDGHLFPADTAQHAEVAGTEDGAGGEDLLAGRQVLAGRAARARPAAAGADTQTWSPSLRVVSTMATASAPSGKGAPVMMRSASPGPTGRAGACPAARVPITVNRAGWSALAVGHVGGPHRVAVHGRVGERRHVLGRGHRLGQHQPDGVADLRPPGAAWAGRPR